MRLRVASGLLLMGMIGALTPVIAHGQQLPVTQRVVPSRASTDTLIQCSPNALAANRPAPTVKPATKPRPKRKRIVHRVAPVKVAPKPVLVSDSAAVVPPPVKRRPVVRRVRRTPVAAVVKKAAPTIIMCRPIHPLPPVSSAAMPSPSMVPIPGQPALPIVTPAIPPETAGPFLTPEGGFHGRSLLPIGIIPAVFIPFIHSGGHHDTDTTTTPVVPPPTTPPDTTITTTPEPSSLALVASGLVGLVGMERKRRKRRVDTRGAP